MQIKCKIRPGMIRAQYPITVKIIHAIPWPTRPLYICPAPGMNKLRTAAVPLLGRLVTTTTGDAGMLDPNSRRISIRAFSFQVDFLAFFGCQFHSFTFFICVVGGVALPGPVL